MICSGLCFFRLILESPLAPTGSHRDSHSGWYRFRGEGHPEHPESQKPPTESQLRHENARLQRENARLQLKLDHAEKLAALQKKFTEMLEAQERDEIDGNSA